MTTEHNMPTQLSKPSTKHQHQEIPCGAQGRDHSQPVQPSILGYAIGCDESNAIFSASQQHSRRNVSPNWVAFLDIANALVHADRISSSTLSPLYEGTSRNNSGFMLAVLLGEGLVCPLDRHYMRQDFKPFLQHINALIAAGVDLGDADEALQASEALAANADAKVAMCPRSMWSSCLLPNVAVLLNGHSCDRPSWRCYGHSRFHPSAHSHVHAAC
jgi:hypothetical protein